MWQVTDDDDDGGSGGGGGDNVINLEIYRHAYKPYT